MRWIGQIVGMVATAALVSSFQCRRERTIAAFWTASAALFVLHYLLLGELSGAVMESALLLRNLLAVSRKPWVLRRSTMWVLLALIVGAALLSWEGWFSLFPLLALIGSTVALWSDKARVIKTTQLLVTSPAWMVYNIHVLSWAGIVCETLDIVSVLVYFIRERLEKRKGATD